MVNARIHYTKQLLGIVEEELEDNQYRLNRAERQIVKLQKERRDLIETLRDLEGDLDIAEKDEGLVINLDEFIKHEGTIKRG